MENKKTFCINLRRIMKEKSILSKELSYDTGIPKQTIENYRLRTNPIIPNVFNALKIANALNVSVEYLCKDI